MFFHYIEFQGLCEYVPNIYVDFSFNRNIHGREIDGSLTSLTLIRVPSESYTKG